MPPDLLFDLYTFEDPGLRMSWVLIDSLPITGCYASFP